MTYSLLDISDVAFIDDDSPRTIYGWSDGDMGAMRVETLDVHYYCDHGCCIADLVGTFDIAPREDHPHRADTALVIDDGRAVAYSWGDHPCPDSTDSCVYCAYCERHLWSGVTRDSQCDDCGSESDRTDTLSLVSRLAPFAVSPWQGYRRGIYGAMLDARRAAERGDWAEALATLSRAADGAPSLDDAETVVVPDIERRVLGPDSPRTVPTGRTLRAVLDADSIVSGRVWDLEATWEALDISP